MRTYFLRDDYIIKGEPTGQRDDEYIELGNASIHQSDDSAVFTLDKVYIQKANILFNFDEE